MSSSFQQFGYFIYLSVLYSVLVVVVSKKADRERLDRKLALDLSILIMVSGFLGGRLVHVLWESPIYYRNNWIEILKFWNGGFVFFGGALCAFVTSFLFLKIKNRDFWSWADFFTPVFSIGYALGRVSCLISGCCYGGTCEIWRPLFERHPTQIYAIVAELIVFSIILKLRRTDFVKVSGLLFLSWAILHSIGRLIMEYFREDFRGSDIFNLSLGTFISLIIITVSILTMLIRMRISNKEIGSN